MTAYYNEIDPFAAQWLRNLIAAGHIAPGDVDERSITEIMPDELMRYTQCHFFAGIGVWSHALRQSGWADDRPVWTGSCPCQPFSAAGGRKGTDDERHLFPAWEALIRECNPACIFGEQVASSEVIGKVNGSGEGVWLDVVQTHLEAAQYAFGSAVTTASGFGAPHVRARTYFVAERLANTDDEGSQRRVERGDGVAGWMGDSSSEPCERRAGSFSSEKAEVRGQGCSNGHDNNGHSDASEASRMADTNGGNTGTERQQRSWQYGQLKKDSSALNETDRPGPVNGFWSSVDWIGCRDDRFRPVEPGTFPLANGATNRMGKIRAYGNALCAAQAAGFISAYLDQ